MVAGVVALALAVLAVMLVDRTTGDDDRSNETGPTASPPSADTTSDQNANPSDQDDASNAGPTRDGGNGPGANQTPAPAVPAGQRAATFIDEYFDTVPADLDGGWQMLSPDYQAQTGRGTYDGFWGTVDSVDATEISPQPGGDAVEATVTYSYADGRTVSERQRIYLVDSPDGPRIDGYDTI